MSRALALLSFLALASCSSTQDREAGAIFLSVANRTRAPQELEEIWIAPHAVKIHHDLGPDGTPKRITLARLDAGVLYEIDPAAKTYAEYRFDWLAAKMDRGDGPEYQVMPYEYTDVAGQRAEGFLVMREGRSVGKVWVARDVWPETSTAMLWRVYHRFRGFTTILRQLPGVIVKQEFAFPDYAYASEAQAVAVLEETPPDLFDLPTGYTKQQPEER